MTTKITDHVVQALARRSQQFKNKTKYENLLSALTQEVQPMEDALWQLFTERTIDTAIGAQLDDIGLIVGQLREGLSDSDYRRLVRARISVNNSQGLVADLIGVSVLIVDDATAEIIIKQQPTAAVVVQILETIPTSAVVGFLIDFLLDTVSAGVRLILETLEDVDAETFFTATFTSLVGAHGSGATTLVVASTAGFLTSGSLDLDPGLAVAEPFLYSGITATSFIYGGTSTVNAHADGAAVQQTGAPGKGLGDDAVSATGGKFSTATDSV